MKTLPVDLHEKKERLVGYCREKGIELVVLFGSCAAGKVYAGSDLDLAVLTRKGAALSRLELLFDMESLFDPMEVDLVLLGPGTDPLLLYEIFMRGMPLFEARLGAFQERRLLAWKIYLDTAPLRELERDYVKRSDERRAHVS